MEKKVSLKYTKFQLALMLEKIAWTYGLSRYRNVVPFVDYYSKSDLVDMLCLALNSI